MAYMTHISDSGNGSEVITNLCFTETVETEYNGSALPLVLEQWGVDIEFGSIRVASRHTPLCSTLTHGTRALSFVDFAQPKISSDTALTKLHGSKAKRLRFTPELGPRASPGKRTKARSSAPTEKQTLSSGTEPDESA